MSIEEKAKAYDEALKKIQSLYEQAKKDDNPIWSTYEHLFPQLRESEDERINRLIYCIVRDVSKAGEILRANGLSVDDALSYLEKQKEQKPAEKQDYSGLTDLERAIHRGFLSAEVENVPVTIIKETAKECLAQMKPAWSEEDEKLLNYAISMTDDAQVERFLKSLRPQPKQEWSEDDKGILLSVKCVIDEVWHSKNNTTDCPANELEEMWHWLDTLWQRVEYPQPSWKPGEEQMEALERASTNKYLSAKQFDILVSLYEQLKKLWYDTGRKTITT